MLFSPSAEDEYFEGLEGLPDHVGIPEILLALESLTEKQRFVIELRYGLRTGEPHSQDWVAELMGASQVAVSRLEERALLKLRQILA